MFSKINDLQNLLAKLSEALSCSKTKRYTANQILKAENINLSEGATLNIQMNNTLLSLDIVHECLQIVNGLKEILPMENDGALDHMLNHYKDFMITKALKDSQYRHKDTAKLLGMTERQLRYCIQKNPQLIERNEV